MSLTAAAESRQNLELTEAAAWADVGAGGHGFHVRRFGAAVAMVTPEIDVLAYNRVIGLGLDGPVDDALIERVERHYADSGARRFFLQLSPPVERDLAHRLEARGFVRHNHWMKLSREVGPPPAVDSEFRVERIGREHTQTFARLFVGNFDWPASTAAGVAEPVGRPGWYHYLAWADERPVATAAMFVDGENAWIDFASTRPEARGRGAQSALVTRRIADCGDLGVRLMIVETSEPTDDDPAPSYRNMRRLGFRVAYRRPNYLRTIDLESK